MSPILFSGFTDVFRNLNNPIRLKGCLVSLDFPLSGCLLRGADVQTLDRESDIFQYPYYRSPNGKTPSATSPISVEELFGSSSRPRSTLVLGQFCVPRTVSNSTV